MSHVFIGSPGTFEIVQIGPYYDEHLIPSCDLIDEFPGAGIERGFHFRLGTGCQPGIYVVLCKAKGNNLEPGGDCRSDGAEGSDRESLRGDKSTLVVIHWVICGQVHRLGMRSLGGFGEYPVICSTHRQYIAVRSQGEVFQIVFLS